MNKINFIVILLFSLLALTIGDSVKQATPKKKLIQLTEDNVVTLRGEINGLSTAKFLSKLLSLQSNEIYIYLVTPGGSVIHGSQIVSAIDALVQQGKKVYCVSDVAASMGFVITQACPMRYIRENSILMQHQMSLGLEGPLEQVKSRLNFTYQMNEHLKTMQYTRLNMTERQYFDTVNNDWWMYGNNALKNNAADEIVNVVCSQELLKGKNKVTVYTFFGSFELVYSDCSVIWDPLDVKLLVTPNEASLMRHIEENKEKYYMSEYVNKQLTQQNINTGK